MIHNFLVTPLGISDYRNDNLEEMIDQFNGFRCQIQEESNAVRLNINYLWNLRSGGLTKAQDWSKSDLAEELM